jgi:hypothetical protein
MPHDQIFDQVISRGLRPSFPRSSPAELVRLAGSCWAAGPRERPAFGEVVQRLELLLAAVSIVATARALPAQRAAAAAVAAQDGGDGASDGDA